MRKFIIMALFLVLLGAGCAPVTNVTENQNNDASTEAELHDWYITFDNGQEWFAYKSYLSGKNKFGTPVDKSTDRGQNNAIIQNTNKAIQLPNLGFFEGIEYDNSEKWIMMDVTAYPETANMPNDLDMIDADGRQLGVRRGNKFDAWYFNTDNRLYEIIPRKHENSETDIDEVMKTIVEL